MPIEKVQINSFLALAATCPVFDVRSPGEFAYGHIPGAYSLPLFTDDQRKEIGTTYKQVSRKEAIRIGLRYFGPNLNGYISQVEEVLGERKNHDSKKILVHCWRGGMRSGAMAWLLGFYGFDVVLLEGGYKSYRQWVLRQLELPFVFNVLGGFTGSGKTEVLRHLAKKGIPVIDLEGIANHKGSAFGGMGMGEQPSQEHFENMLADALQPYYTFEETQGFKQDTPVWIENESQRIGPVNIGNSLYARMQQGALFNLDVPFEKRLGFILTHYGGFERERLVNAVIRIQKRLGGLDTKNAIGFLLENNTRGCFEILLRYYDKQYTQTMQRTERKSVIISAGEIDPAANAETLLSSAVQTPS